MSVAVLACALPFATAHVVFEGDGWFAEGYVADSGRRAAVRVGTSRDSLEFQGVIRGRKASGYDLVAGEVSAQESGLREPLELFNLWSTDDPKAETVFEPSELVFERGSETVVAGQTCETFVARDEGGVTYTVARAHGITLSVERSGGMVATSVRATLFETNVEVNPAFFTPPEGMFPHH